MGKKIVDDTFSSVALGGDNMCVVVAEEGFHIAISGLIASEYPKGNFQFEIPKGSESIYYKGETDNEKIGVYSNSERFFFRALGAEGLGVKVIELGDWNMDLTASISIAHGLDKDKIRLLQVLIIPDADYFPDNRWNIESGYSSSSWEGAVSVNGDNVDIKRNSPGFYDQVGFDSTGFNRGWLTILYEN